MSKELLQVKCVDADDYYAMYAAGYYVNADASDNFFWDRENTRCVIWGTHPTRSKALRLLRECSLPCTYTFCRHSAALLELLVKEKPHKWLTPFVISIYEQLLAARLAFTVEATIDDAVVGGLFGVAVGDVLTLDTMVGSSASAGHRSASKAALCQLALCAIRYGIKIIDVEVKHSHDHPAARLGEHEIAISDFRRHLAGLSASRNSFVEAHIGQALP